MTEPTPPRRRPHALEAVLLAVAFAAAHTQSPLYYSNQNQYLLHGLADGGLGHLSHDWLARTTDPTPVFSALVSAGYRHLGEWSFQAAYFLLLVLYFLSARWLVAALPGVIHVAQVDGAFVLEANGAGDPARAAGEAMQQAGWPILELRQERPGLEDVFLGLVRDGGRA